MGGKSGEEEKGVIRETGKGAKKKEKKRKKISSRTQEG